jgi:hypothetical protein
LGLHNFAQDGIYNNLHMIDQETLLRPDAPPDHPAKRRRVKTVIQEIITLAVRIKRHAQQWILAFRPIPSLLPPSSGLVHALGHS